MGLTVFEAQVLAIDIAAFAQSLLEHLEIGIELLRARVQHPDTVAPGCGLRARRQRCRRRAGEPGDEFSPFHSALIAPRARIKVPPAHAGNRTGRETSPVPAGWRPTCRACPRAAS